MVLLQGNVPQDEKFAPERISAAIDWHVRELLAARDAGVDLVIAPETALVLLPAEMPPGFWDSLQRMFSAGRTHALFGVPMGSAADGYTNSAVGLAPGQPVGASPYRYDKHHLVPFGEFIPLGFRWFTEMMNIPLGDFDRGPLVAPSMPVAGQRVAPNICYEDLFGEELAARFTDSGALADDLRQPQQHRLVRRHDRDRPAPADLAHAHARAAAADAARHQHRRHRGHRPPRAR